jgi:Family of unknown function (DUF6636)
MRTVLLAVALTLGVPATAAATYRDFRSPSGQLGCAFYSDAETPPFVRCDWRRSGDRGVQVGETGRARVRHVTDTVLNPDARVLRYGRRTTFRQLRCRSRRSGITCRSLRSGHGFTVSVEKRTLF